MHHEDLAFIWLEGLVNKAESEGEDGEADMIFDIINKMIDGGMVYLTGLDRICLGDDCTKYLIDTGLCFYDTDR
jgi:hypothetical protein